jgi:hypothetical protein
MEGRMNQHIGRERRRSGGAEGSERRNDTTLAAVIDLAVRFDAEQGVALAWAFLARHGVPPATILRVLSAPPEGHAPRRTPDSMMPPAPLQ